MGAIQPSPSVDRIILANEPEFALGDLRIKPASLEVIRSGQRRELQPRVMQVLIALAKARPAVVSRDRLSVQCWDGLIVGDDALNRCILALRHLAQEFAPQSFTIETVPRVGHRLVEGGTPRGSWPRAWIGDWRVALAALAIIVAAALAVWQHRERAAEPASIAVLPFRNLGSGDPYFAEGVSEEILSMLTREPEFSVAGSSSSALAAKGTDPVQAAKRLRVNYVIEGTVRRQGDRIRVNAHLLRASDGVRIWTDSYDGKLDDILAIQRTIGTAVAGSLRRKLGGAPADSRRIAADGNAYSLYLTARGLLRTRNRRVGPVAADLLREAVQIDPGFAPAWARLAEATLLGGALHDPETFLRSASQAQRYARHAVRLAPDLPEAHRALGIVQGFGTPEAVAHLRRAAELDPNSAENLVGLGAAYGGIGEFDKEVDAYRQALKIDRLWFRPISALAVSVAEMGARREAERIATRGLQPEDVQRGLLLGKTAAISGDFSEAIRQWSIVARSGSPRWSDAAARMRDDMAFFLRLRENPSAAVPRPLEQRHLYRISATTPPDHGLWRLRNRSAIAAAVYRDDNHVAAKLMLNAGRWRELADAYDRPGGMIGLRRGAHLRADQLSEVPVAVLALRGVGRRADAESLLNEAGKLADMIDRRGRVPTWFDRDVAAILALQGRKSEALARLTRAVQRGWRHGGSTDLRDFADEPAFQSLHGHPRFETLRSQLSVHYQRERQESAQVLGLKI